MKTAQKILQLLDMLSGIRRYTTKEIRERLQLSERGLYRYIKVLKDFGFVIDKDDRGYILKKNNKAAKELSSLLHFSEEEAYILNEAINNIPATTKPRQSLIAKLSALYDTDRIAIRFTAKEQSSKIKPLLEAIRNKRQVKVLDYRSSGGGTVTDRILEPFGFTTNYISIWAYEPESGENKLFKVERMKKVEPTEKEWRFENEHHADPVDCFRVAGKKKMNVRFEMSLLAKNLLTEEYPLSEPFIRTVNENRYVFEGWVAAPEGIGRFILGLPGEISHLENKEIRRYIEKKRKNLKNNSQHDK
jgi:predicted DNA-binding transcriptional regulator YafY